LEMAREYFGFVVLEPVPPPQNCCRCLLDFIWLRLRDQTVKSFSRR
jgi:hypothetical protein